MAFGKKTSTSQPQTLTSDQLFDHAMNIFGTKMTTLNSRKDDALSSFRRAADDLDTINKGIADNIEQANKVISYFSSQKTAATQQMADNAAVRDKIMSIISPDTPTSPETEKFVDSIINDGDKEDTENK